MKGIVLAGGSGTRLYPLTSTTSKQLLPVYDKPAIYYPISTLMLSGIREILIISTPRDLPVIEKLMGDGSKIGVTFTYKVQEKPEGIAQAFILGADFIKDSGVALILGDNLFYGDRLAELLQNSFQNIGATIFAHHVSDPERYGVLNLDENGKPSSIEEKPKHPKSKWAVTGLYTYDKNVIEIAKNLKPSNRGELEITEVNKVYLEQKKLNSVFLGRGFSWLDVGTPDALLTAATFVQTIENRQGLKIACLEEIAWRKKFISDRDFLNLIEALPNCDYKSYLLSLVK